MQNSVNNPAEFLCRVMKRIYDRQLTTLTGGNLSMMDENGVMWVTPTGIDKGGLVPEDIVRVYPDGHFEGKHRPTSEYRIHWRIMQEHPEFRAVAHAHSPAIVTMSVLHEPTDTRLLLQAHEAIGEVELAEYGMPGTVKLVECVADTFEKGCDAAILKNHAAFLAARGDLNDAYRRFEMLDLVSNIELNALALGQLQALSADQFDAYRASIKAYALSEERGMAEKEAGIRSELVEIGTRAYTRRFFCGMFGSISARVDEHSFLINRKDADRGQLCETDFVRIEGDTCYGATPDDLTALHQAIYEANPEINSVILAAPAYLTAFAICERPYDVTLIPESYGVLRDVVEIPFDEMLHGASGIAERMSLKKPFAIMRNLGSLVVGPDIKLTFDKLEVAEFTAISLYQAAQTGKTIVPMDDEMRKEQDACS